MLQVKEELLLQEKASLWSYITEPEDVDDDSEGFQEVESQPSRVEEEPESDPNVGMDLPGQSSKAPSKGAKQPHQAYDMYKRCALHESGDPFGLNF